MHTTAIVATLLGGMLSMASGPAASAAACERRSPAKPPLVLELYTSEGCSSCPPADRWLSQLKGRDDVLPLAFHVGYWNRLGWVDRFATRETTDRQYQMAKVQGLPNVYTPQVLAQGRDWPTWHRDGALPDVASTAPVTIVLRRDGARVTAEVAAGAPATRWTGYWAVVEDGHRSRVTAGENRGENLVHDHVVRRYQPVAAWTGAQQMTLDLSPPDPQHPRRVVFVVSDPATLRPVQAVSLDC
ncbi:MAG: DUF1223 domain-containing protein [Burkholderiaceae bacterium]|nr:DUF1223 domain-containing protein [Burkholderiaceae bacterium]